MAITRSNPSGWTKNSPLTKTQITNLDKNIESMLDKRAGKEDEIKSYLGLGANSMLLFDTDSEINIYSDDTTRSIKIAQTGGTTSTVNAYPVTITSGSLKLGAELVGDDCPLRFGYIELDITGISTVRTLIAKEYRNLILSFIAKNNPGYIPQIVVPNVAGYYKLIRNSILSTVEIRVIAAANIITIQPGHTSLIYCDGSEIYEVSTDDIEKVVSRKIYVNSNNFVLDIISKDENNSKLFLDGYSAVYNVNNVNLIGKNGNIKLQSLTGYDKYPIFNNVLAGDKFEIRFHCGAINLSNLASESYVCPYVEYGTGITISQDFPQIINPTRNTLYANTILTTTTNNVIGSRSMVYTARTNGSYWFKLFIYNNYKSDFGYIATPFTYDITQYRF